MIVGTFKGLPHEDDQTTKSAISNVSDPNGLRDNDFTYLR